MKTNLFRFVKIIVILVFLLGSANLQPVLAQDETPAPTDPVVVVTESPTENVTEEPAATEVPATEVVTGVPTEVATEIVTEVPTEAPTEAPPVEVDLTEIVDQFAAEDVRLAGSDGDPLAMGSQEAAVALVDGDPYFTRGGVTYIFLPEGSTCPPDTATSICVVVDNPIQAAIDDVGTNGAPTDKTIHVLAGTYNNTVTITNNNNYDGLILMGDPGNTTEVGAASSATAPILDGLGLDPDATGITILNQGVSIIGFIIQRYGTGIFAHYSTGNEGIVISNNTIIDNGIGINQVGEQGKPGITANFNIFTGNNVAIYNSENPSNHNVQYLDAKNNYWGCPSGPYVEMQDRFGVTHYYQFAANGSGYEVSSVPTGCQKLNGDPSLWDHQINTPDWSPYKINLNPFVPCPPDQILENGVCITPTRALSIVKTVTPSTYDEVGDVLSYSYEVKNVGNVTLSGPFTVTDDKATASCPATATLSPDATITCTASYTVSQADLDTGSVTNVAYASNGEVTSPTDTETATAEQSSGLSIAKTADESSFDSTTDSLNYNYTITNTGNVTLTGQFTVTDDKINGGVAFNCGAAGTVLAPGGTVTCESTPYAITQADLDAGYVTNIAYGHLGELTSLPDDVTVNANQYRTISIAKTADEINYDAITDTLNYNYTITNTGNVTLTGQFTVTDNKINGGVAFNCGVAGTVLAPGGTVTCESTPYAITQADLDAGYVTNIAYGHLGELTSLPDDVTVEAEQDESISIAKTADESSFDSTTDTLNYNYTITNTGNVTLTGQFTVTDNKINGGVAFNCGAAGTSLAPGGTVTCESTPYAITQADLDAGYVTNIAYGHLGELTSLPDDVTVSARQVESISIAKTADESSFDSTTDTLNYNYTITNTGNVTLTGQFTVTDNKINGGVSFNCGAAGTVLAPGGTVTCESTAYAITQADLDAGYVTNTAYGHLGELTSLPDDVTVNAAQIAAFSISKTVTSTGPYLLGSTISYNIVLTNIGNVTLHNVSISDPAAVLGACPVTPELPVGGTKSCTATHVVTAADVTAGTFTNTGIGESDETDPGSSSVTSTITTLPPPPPPPPPLVIPVTGTGGQLIPVTGGTLIVSGLGHSCMTYNDGKVICWGLNTSGQLGDGTNIDQKVPVYVKDLTGVQNLVAGSEHTCALTIDGDVWCWGENASGQLGNGKVEDSSLPVMVTGLPEKVLTMTAGDEFTCVQLMNQEVWCWGKNDLGQLNDGTTTNQLKPVKTKLDTLFAQISGGQGLLLGSDVLGSVNEWAKVVASTVKQVAGALSISANRWGSTGCVVTSDGSVKCWGSDLSSMLVPGSMPAIEVGAGMDHNCDINNDQTVSCWGTNDDGELGNGTNEDSSSATLVKNLSNARVLGVGAQHTCVLAGTSNFAWCWGQNTYGQLGNNTTTNSNVPVLVILPASQ